MERELLRRRRAQAAEEPVYAVPHGLLHEGEKPSQHGTGALVWFPLLCCPALPRRKSSPGFEKTSAAVDLAARGVWPFNRFGIQLASRGGESEREGKLLRLTWRGEARSATWTAVIGRRRRPVQRIAGGPRRICCGWAAGFRSIAHVCSLTLIARRRDR